MLLVLGEERLPRGAEATYRDELRKCYKELAGEMTSLKSLDVDSEVVDQMRSW